MKPNMPKTPFSMSLSRSVKETELRIRNIFQWKKKRPPVVLFLLTAMLVLMCCSLVSCQVEDSSVGGDSLNHSDGMNTDISWNDHENVPTKYKEDFHTFLLLGCDGDAGNVDTLMVAAYNVRENKINILSIPRDTLMDVSRKAKKIGFAYSEGGTKQVIDEVSGILGFCPDYYIKVDLQAFEDVVNILGGISYNVPNDMYYCDEAADFVIDLKAGEQMLDGDHALQLVRYRGYSNADLGRIQTQQGVLRELARKAVSLSSTTKVNELVQVIYGHVETNLSVAELTYFGVQAMSLDFSEDVTFATLPGTTKNTESGWGYELDVEGTSALVNTTINPYTMDIGGKTSDQELIVPRQDEIRENGYPVNGRGETYGGNVKELQIEPDLILVQNSRGVLGYVRASDFNGPEHSTPEEAIQYSKSHSGPGIVNVYLQDGKTVIGSFYIGG